jgi:hypothetical protein
VTTQSQLHPQRAETMSHANDEAVDRSTATQRKSGEMPEDTLTLGDGSEHPAADSGRPENAESAVSSVSGHPGLDADEADRFALAFRPSWAPLETTAVRHSAVPASKPLPIDHSVVAIPTTISRDEPLTVPVRRMKRRAAAWTSLSVASFIALAYWGVSSSSKPTHHTHISAAKHAPSPTPPAVPPVPTREVEPTAAIPSAATTTTAALPPSAAIANVPAAASPPPAAVEDVPAAVPPPPAAEDVPAAVAAAETEAVQTPAARVAEPASKAIVSAPASIAVHPKNAVPTDEPTRARPEATVSAAAMTASSTPKQAATPAVNAKPASDSALVRDEPGPLHTHKPLLVVRAMPDGARLWLDGQRMANPFDVRLPRSSKHRVEARADGYETTSQQVRLDSDAKLSITLRRTPQHASRASLPTPLRSASNATPAQRPRETAVKRHRGAGFVSVSPY